MEREFKYKDKLLNSVFQVANVGICVTNEQGKFEVVNDAYCRIYGYTREELIGSKFTIVVPPEYIEATFQLHQEFIEGKPEVDAEWKVMKKDRSLIDVFVTAGLLILDNGSRFKVTTVTDISGRKKDEQTIKYLSNYSTVTNLPQRHIIEKELSRLVEDFSMESGRIFLILVDLDKFKTVNDNYGFKAGDKLLLETGKRIGDCLRGNSVLSYFGEDHFCVLMSGQCCAEEAGQTAEAIIEQLNKTFYIDGKEINISCSIGISVFSEESSSVKELIIHAEKAVEEAKKQGINTIKFYTKELNESLLRRVKLETALKNAVRNEELFLTYQPQVSLDTMNMVGVEALLRWRHPEFGLISPAEFIPIAEETGLISGIGKWVIKTACRQIADWKSKGVHFSKVAVNVSPRQINQQDFISSMSSILKETGTFPGELELELTESTMMEDIRKSVQVFEQIKSMGIKIAIDDFGTGYSSLNYLRKIPINKLKIDRSFIADLNDNFESSIITKTIIDMGKNLGFKVIAEGAETEEHIKYLKANNCDEVQGYYFSKPLMPEELEGFIKKMTK